MASLPDSPKTGVDPQFNAPASCRISLREKVRQAARQVESELIMEALERHRWNRRQTADALKISYRSLMYKMKICNLRGDVRTNQSAGD